MNVYAHIALSDKCGLYNMYTIHHKLKNSKQINYLNNLIIIETQTCFHHILLNVPFTSKYAE